jgi:tRNA G18 (ribose-2'-O)-methylase SpoU
MRKLKNNELNRIDVASFKSAKKTPIIVILDNIRSLNNVGSVFRTSDAFLIEKIYLCGITATPPNKDIQKTALGATDSVEWEYRKSTIDLVNELHNKGVQIASIEQADESTSLADFYLEKDKKYAVIFGNEVKGVQQKVVDASDYCVEIPQFGTKHSFNISVSVGIVLWDLFRKISIRPLHNR